MELNLPREQWEKSPILLRAELRLRLKSADVIEDNSFGISEKIPPCCHWEYPDMTVTLGSFHLQIDAGVFTNSQIIVLMGRNSTGKTTFMNTFTGRSQPNDGKAVPQISTVTKSQKLLNQESTTVRQMLSTKISEALSSLEFQADVYLPLRLDAIANRQMRSLSFAELQRVALVLCLGTPADVYFIDEPCAYLDPQQREIAARVIKGFTLRGRKTTFVSEHDPAVAAYLADKIIIFDGQPGTQCRANAPESLSGLL